MKPKICINLDDRTRVSTNGGSSNYNELSNKPQINGVTLENNKTAQELNLATNSDLRRNLGFWLSAVDKVFLGKSVSVNLLAEPTLIIVDTETGSGVVNNDYSLGLVDGKNYAVVLSVKKADGTEEDVTLNAIASTQEDTNMVFLSMNYGEETALMVADGANLTVEEPIVGDNKSALVVQDTSRNIEEIIFKSIVQQLPNLLKAPIDVTGGGEEIRQLGYKIGLEYDTPYSLVFEYEGEEYETKRVYIQDVLDPEEEPTVSEMRYLVSSMPLDLSTKGATGRYLGVALYDGIVLDEEGNVVENVVEADDCAYAVMAIDSETDELLSGAKLTRISKSTEPPTLSFPLVIENATSSFDNITEMSLFYYKTAERILPKAETEIDMRVVGSFIVDGTRVDFDETVTYDPEYPEDGICISVSPIDTVEVYHASQRIYIVQGISIMPKEFVQDKDDYLTIAIDVFRPDDSSKQITELRIDSITVV